MWHPIRMAEDYAMADIVTDGRVIMGVGRGYHTREVESFGAPLIDAEKNRDLFEEQLQLLLTCFNEPEFHFKGKFYECAAAGASTAATRSRTSPWCRGRRTCRWRSGCRSPAARPST